MCSIKPQFWKWVSRAEGKYKIKQLCLLQLTQKKSHNAPLIFCMLYLAQLKHSVVTHKTAWGHEWCRSWMFPGMFPFRQHQKWKPENSTYIFLEKGTLMGVINPLPVKKMEKDPGWWHDLTFIFELIYPSHNSWNSSL